MKIVSLALALAAFVIAPVAMAQEVTAEATIKKMSDDFNKGDIDAVRAAHLPDATIVDNVPPFAWSGPRSFDRFLGDLMKAEEVAGKTDGLVTFWPVVDKEVSGDRAYVVTESVYSYKQKGVAMREAGYTAFVLVKKGSQWKIESWSWATPAAVPVK